MDKEREGRGGGILKGKRKRHENRRKRENERKRMDIKEVKGGKIKWTSFPIVDNSRKKQEFFPENQAQ